MELQKPVNDDRLYRFVTLEKNKLHCLLVSDPKTEKVLYSIVYRMWRVCFICFSDRKMCLCAHFVSQGCCKYGHSYRPFQCT